ncbi:MAG: hypothetical protein R6U50_18580 [Desulfobacterales bacterium]
MFLAELFTAVVIAAVLTILIAVVFRGESWGLGMFLFFLILFLATWAGGLWITPFGPVMWGVPWLSFFFIGLLIALVFAVFMPSRNRRTPRTLTKAEREARFESDTVITIDIFLWILLAFLLIGIITAYVR